MTFPRQATRDHRAVHRVDGQVIFTQPPRDREIKKKDLWSNIRMHREGLSAKLPAPRSRKERNETDDRQLGQHSKIRAISGSATKSAPTMKTLRRFFEDDGSGFGLEVPGRLFERRVKGRDSGGHGFGLAFVNAVARAHGGTAEASNHEGGGVQVVVTLPIASQERTHTAVAAIFGLN